MAFLITEAVKIGEGAWRYSWSGTAPFDIMLGGNVVLSQTDNTSLIVQWQDEPHASTIEPPAIEGVDSTEDRADLCQSLLPPFITLQFRGKTTNAYYKIEAYDGADWQTITTMAESGRGYYKFTSPTRMTFTYDLRVVPYDESGTAGTPLELTFFHHTHPAPRDLTYTYDAGTNNLTIDEA